MISLEFEGLEAFVRELGVHIDQIEKEVEAALYREGEELMTASQPLVPVDEGVLKSSGFVQLPAKDEGGSVFVEVGYGGPAGSGNHNNQTNTEDVAYAVVQHEDLTFFHTVGQAKFLEQPLVERQSGYSDRLASRIRKKL